MRSKRSILVLAALISIASVVAAFALGKSSIDDEILSYSVDPRSMDVRLYWRDDDGDLIGSFAELKEFTEAKGRDLIFAMNAGMYNEDRSPVGLFIQDQQTITNLNTANGSGNFHMKPNGVFYLTTDRNAGICTTENFEHNGSVQYATQSGPMLVIDGALHPAFVEGSENLHIRNGVGILPDGRLIFAMSKTKINFFDFANYFKAQGCRNALYLDGFVSRTYLPEQNWLQTDGNFGVMIAVTSAK